MHQLRRPRKNRPGARTLRANEVFVRRGGLFCVLPIKHEATFARVPEQEAHGPREGELSGGNSWRECGEAFDTGPHRTRYAGTGIYALSRRSRPSLAG